MRDARKLADGEWGPLVAVLPVHKSPEEFPKEFSAIECPEQIDLELRKTWPVIRDNIQFFLEKVHGPRSWVERQGGHTGVSGPRRKSYRWSVDATPGDPDDSDDRWLESRWLTVSQPTGDTTRDELLDLDLDPEEVEEHWLLVSPEEPAPDLRELAIESALTSRGQRRHVQLAH